MTVGLAGWAGWFADALTPRERQPVPTTLTTTPMPPRHQGNSGN
jgi:hypothetical protein